MASEALGRQTSSSSGPASLATTRSSAAPTEKLPYPQKYFEGQYDEESLRLMAYFLYWSTTRPSIKNLRIFYMHFVEGQSVEAIKENLATKGKTADTQGPGRQSYTTENLAAWFIRTVNRLLNFFYGTPVPIQAKLEKGLIPVTREGINNDRKHIYNASKVFLPVASGEHPYPYTQDEKIRALMKEIYPAESERKERGEKISYKVIEAAFDEEMMMSEILSTKHPQKGLESWLNAKDPVMRLIFDKHAV